MKAHNPMQNATDFEHFATINVEAIARHGFYTYLCSFADVAIALSILISICSISLLMLYSALGAI